LRNAPLATVLALSTVLAGSAFAKEMVVDQPAGDAMGFAAYLSARFAAGEHDMAGAARYFSVSAERVPDDPTLLAAASFYATTAGDIDQSVKIARKIVATTPDDRISRLVLATDALKHGDYKGARAEIGKSAKGAFTVLTIALVDAWAAAGAGDGDGALADLKMLRGQAGFDAIVAFHQALLLDYLGRTQEADAAYSEALKTDGPSPRLVNAYGRFLERNGRAAEASALYAKLAGNAALGPVFAEAAARIARGEKPQALIRTPQDGASEALFGIAASLSEEASVDVSILYLRLSLHLQPGFDLGNILLGDRLETLQDLPGAIAAYRVVDKNSPYRRMAAIQIATDEARLDKTDDAIRDLKALTDASPKDIEAWTALGDADRAADKFDDAVKAYDRAVAALGTPGKKDWTLFFARAIARDRAHDWPGAEADLQLALKLSPDEPQTLNYLGYSWVDQGRNIKDALTMLEKARSLKPYDGYIVDSVGWAYYRLGRYGDAAKTLEDAILLVPGDPTINDHYGDALWKVGRKLDARFQWDHALAFGPTGDEKAEIEKKLQSDGGEQH
jgi:tetratricopeptide (TPR) repeat protein